MNNLMNEFNKVIRWPKKLSDKEIIIKWLSMKFNFDKKYSEKQINAILEKHHLFNDIALLRRELISREYLGRKNNGSQYWRVK